MGGAEGIEPAIVRLEVVPPASNADGVTKLSYTLYSDCRGQVRTDHPRLVETLLYPLS